jgi:hypothetical protein
MEIIVMADFDYSSLLGTLLGASAQAKTNKDVQGLNDQLKQSYTNPSSLYGQYSATDKQFYNDLQAQNAASGRTTDAYKTGVAREAAYNNWLTQYRNNLSNQVNNYAKTATTYNTANPWMTVLGTLLSNQKGADGQSVSNPLKQQVNSGITSALGWLGNQASGLMQSNPYSGYNYQQGSDPIAQQFGSYGNDVSNALSQAISGNNNYNDYGNQAGDAVSSSNYSPDYNAASDPIAQSIGNSGDSAASYNTGGVDYLSNLFGG